MTDRLTVPLSKERTTSDLMFWAGGISGLAIIISLAVVAFSLPLLMLASL